MPNTPDKRQNLSPPKAPAQPQEFSLDPLPVPEAFESDSDTVWGLWEHTLQAQDDTGAAAKSDGAFEATIPGDLTTSDGKKV